MYPVSEAAAPSSSYALDPAEVIPEEEEEAWDVDEEAQASLMYLDETSGQAWFAGASSTEPADAEDGEEGVQPADETSYAAPPTSE